VVAAGEDGAALEVTEAVTSLWWLRGEVLGDKINKLGILMLKKAMFYYRTEWSCALT